MATVLVTSAADPDLVQAAIAGDGMAFATLYDRHERRAFNLAYRITGSREDAADATQEAFLKLLARLPGLADRELDFGSYLLTAVRHASYDVIARAKRAEPTEELPDSARPVGAAAAPPPEQAPDRSVLLAASQEEIRAANATLAPRQREALALRELEGLSYDEIAELMAMNRNSVAQLISRARIALRDALRRTALRSIAPGTPQCERALPLIAMRDDGQLSASDDAGWLDAHLAVCERCVLGREAMAEAGASYRIWAPVPALEILRRETIASAGEHLGHDWNAAAGSPRTVPGATAGSPRAAAGGAAAGAGAGGTGSTFAARARSRRRRDGLGALALCAAILLALLAGQTADGERGPAAAGETRVVQPASEDRAPAPPAPAARPAAAPRPAAGTPAAGTPAAGTPAAGTPVAATPAAAGAPAGAAVPGTARRRPAPVRTKRERDPRPSTTPPATPPPLPPPASTPDTTDPTDPTPPPPPPPGLVPEDPTGGTGAIVVTPPPPPPPRRRPGSFVAPPPPPPPPSSVPVPVP